MNAKRTVIDILKNTTEVLVDEPLMNYTSFKTGGPADILVRPASVDVLRRIIAVSADYDVPSVVIGGGSNVLVPDEGVRGIVIILNEQDECPRLISPEPGGEIFASACVKKSSFIRYCLENGYGGIEFMAGIPGTIGGGIYMNAGTTMGTFVDVLASVELMDQEGNVSVYKAQSITASYREFNIPENNIILGGCFLLPKIDDKALMRERIRHILRDREEKHPLEYPSAGSVFKNPPGHSSWQLIQDSGLKGRRVGGAMISEKHTNFIINVDNATSSDVKNLIDLVKGEVKTRFNLELETEIQMLGSFPEA